MENTKWRTNSYQIYNQNINFILNLGHNHQIIKKTHTLHKSKIQFL